MNLEINSREEVAPIEPLLDVVIEEPITPKEDQAEEIRTKLRKIPSRSLTRSAMNLPTTRLDPGDQTRGWKLTPRQQRMLRSRRMD